MTESVSIGGRPVAGFALGAPAWQYAAVGGGVGAGLLMVSRETVLVPLGQGLGAAAAGALVGVGIWWVVEKSR